MIEFPKITTSTHRGPRYDETSSDRACQMVAARDFRSTRRCSCARRSTLTKVSSSGPTSMRHVRSNSAREEAKVAMQECLDRWNEPQDPPPHVGFN